MIFQALTSLLLTAACPQATTTTAPANVAQDPSKQAYESYSETLPSDVSFEMIALPGGSFSMGSPASEAERKQSEGPQRTLQISPFWIEVHEVTWDEYQLYTKRVSAPSKQTAQRPPGIDAVSRPTPPYMPMDFGMGTGQHPAVCMTQFAAKQYTRWLSLRTAHFYRLPSEAEWEYACRAGTTSAYSWGDDPQLANDYSWSFENADDGYREVMTRKPNPWGLYDMHGNVSEWVLDFFVKDGYSSDGSTRDPIVWPTALYPRVVRGGSWDDDLDRLRSAARRASTKSWKIQDPQLPKSIWYHTNAQFVGFRVVRPRLEPSVEEQEKYWQADLDSIRRTLKRQRRGER